MSFLPMWVLIPIAVLVASESIRSILHTANTLRAYIAAARAARVIKQHLHKTRNGMDATGQALKDLLRNGGGHT